MGAWLRWRRAELGDGGADGGARGRAGSFKWADGDEYMGEWKDNNRNGKGGAGRGGVTGGAVGRLVRGVWGSVEAGRAVVRNAMARRAGSAVMAGLPPSVVDRAREQVAPLPAPRTRTATVTRDVRAPRAHGRRRRC